MGKIKTMLTALVLGLLLLAACAPTAAPAPAPAPAAAPVPAAAVPAPQTSAKPAWEVEWDKTLEAAKKEGMVMLATSATAEVRTPLGEGFKKAYGITLESVTVRASLFPPKILAERRAGLYLWDICLAGASYALNSLKAASLLDPLEPLLILPDLTDPELIKKTWYGGELRWLDRDRTVVMGLLFPESPIAINTNLVKEGEIKSYQDVLNPKWKGKIIFSDPTLSGGAGNTFMPMFVVGGVAGGVDWLQKLLKNEPLVMRDDRLIFEWLAHGKAAIVVAPKTDVATEFLRIGAPIGLITPKEGAALSGSTSGAIALNKRPHPNAHKIFLNWYLSKEGQTAMSQGKGGQSARLDVPTDFLPPERIRQTGMPYYIKEIEENLLRQPEVDKVAKELFGPLIK